MLMEVLSEISFDVSPLAISRLTCLLLTPLIRVLLCLAPLIIIS